MELAGSWPVGALQQSAGAPQASEVIVANQIISLNPLDWKMIERGHPDWQPGHIPGVDGMGIVVARGAGVRRLWAAAWPITNGSSATVASRHSPASLPVPGARGWRVWVTAAPRHNGLLSAMGVSGSFDYHDSQWSKALQAALGQFLPVVTTVCTGQVECKLLVSLNAIDWSVIV